MYLRFARVGSVAAKLCFVPSLLAACLLTALLPLARAQTPQGAVDPRIEEQKSLMLQGMKLRASGQFDEAIAAFKQQTALVREIVGQENADSVAGCLEQLAATYEDKGDLKSALRYRRDVLEIRTALAEKPESKPWQLGDARAESQRTEALAKLSAEALARLKKCDQLSIQAFELIRKGDAAQAIALQKQALATQRELLGDRSNTVANSLFSLGCFALQAKDFTQSAKLLQEALAIRLETVGEVHPATANVLLGLSNALQLGGNPREALPVCQRLLRVLTAIHGPESIELLPALNSLDSVCIVLGDVSQERKTKEQLLAVIRHAHGPESLQAAQVMANLGERRAVLGEHRESRRMLDDAVNIFLRKLPNDMATAGVIEQSALVATLVGDEQGARQRFQQAHEVRTRVLDTLDVDDDRNLAVLSRALSDEVMWSLRQEDVAAVKARGRELMKIYDRMAAGKEVVSNLAFRRGMLLMQLGDAHRRLGDWPAAVARLDEAARLFSEDPPGSKPSDVASALWRLARAEGAQEHWDDALEAMHRAVRVVHQELRLSIWALAESEQLQYLQVWGQPILHDALGLALAQPNDPQAAAFAGACLLNLKSLTYEALTAGTAAPEGAANSAEAHELAVQLRRTRAKLAGLQSRAGKPKSPDKLRQVAELVAEEKRLSRRWAELTAQRPEGSTWRDVDELRATLAAGSVVIDIARIERRDLAGKAPSVPTYLAVVIPPAAEGELRIVSLGSASEIDSIVAEARGQLRVRGGEDEDALAAVAALRRLVFDPLRAVTSAKNWIVIPDGDLWLVPWGAFPLEKGRYAVEERDFSYQVSARELLAKHGTVQANAPVVLANPDFNALTTFKQPSAKRRRLADTQLKRLRTDWDALPGTAREADTIRPSLTKYAGAKPHELLGKAATKDALLAVARPKVLVVSTHGYFLRPPRVRPARADSRGIDLIIDEKPPLNAAAVDVPAEPINPLLLCGLVLAGANQPRAAEGEDARIVSGLEIVGADLAGTELVVLSACETGLGAVRSAEGVAGLRHAFHLAGARAVAATLWKIPDGPTALLMGDFFQNLANGQTKVAALNNAQRHAIETGREHKTARPYYWAAFTLTGQ